MEEEKKVEVEVKNETPKFDLKNVDYKKYLPYIGIAIAVILIIIVLAAALGGGPKKAVKKYVSGMSKGNASKVIASMDFVGTEAWSYKYKADDFSKDDYEEFTDKYKELVKEYDKDDIKDAEKSLKKTLDKGFDTIDDDYKSYKVKVDSFKSVKKLGKDLYAVKAKISVVAKPKDKDDDELDESDIQTFIVYKNKVISGGI